MQLRTEEKLIGAYRYRVTLLDTFTGIDVATRLTTKFGSAFREGRLENIETIIGSLAEKLTKEEVLFYVELFAKKTEVVMPDGKEPFLKDIVLFHFSGKYAEMMQWLAFCFEVNFADFFVMVRERLVPLAKAALATMSSASPSTSAPTPPAAGSSGAS